MISAIPIEEVLDDFSHLPERFNREPGLIVQVTQGGTPIMAVFAWEMYESITETLEIMADPVLMAAIRTSAEDIVNGRTKEWETVKTEW